MLPVVQICYTGGIYDEASKLYYLNARYYDPETGRFLAQDSYRGEMDDPEQWHLYVYCANNPINYVDPSGHFVIKRWMVATPINAAMSYAVGLNGAFQPVKYYLKTVSKQISKKALKNKITGKVTTFVRAAKAKTIAMSSKASKFIRKVIGAKRVL